MEEQSLRARPVLRETPLDGLTVIASDETRPYLDQFWDALPSEVADQLRRVDEQGASMAECGHVLVVGDLQTHSWIQQLYFRSWVSTDLLHPGPGGYELKTLCGALRPDSNVILVGASDAEGIDCGLQRLLGILQEGADAVPFLFEAQASDAVEEAAGELFPAVSPKQDPTERTSWLDAFATAECGAQSVFTGKEELAEYFKLNLLGLSVRDDWELLGELFLMYRVLEAHPMWSEEERAQAVQLFHDFAGGPEGVGTLGRLDEPFSDRLLMPLESHISRRALAVYFIADYLVRFHGLPEAKLWRARAGEVFEAQFSRSKPASDASGYQWNVSALNAARYALDSNESSYFKDGPFRESVKRALQCFTNQGQEALVGGVSGTGTAPWTLFSLAAVACQEGHFLAPIRLWDPELSRLLCPWESGDEFLRSFAADLPTGQDPELVGLTISPLDEHYRDESHRLTPGFYLPPASREGQLFDKITFRSGFRQDDDYLLLDGVSGGEHSYEDANCIKEVQMRGFPWICSLDAGLREGGIAAQNGLLLLRDGERSPLPQFAELLDSHFVAAGGNTVTRLRGYSGADWTRSIFWRAAGFLLVIDEVEIREPGRFQMEARWLCLGRTVEGPWPAFELGDGETDLARLSVGWERSVESEIDEVDYTNEFYAYYVEQNQGKHEVFASCDVPPELHRIRLRKVFDGQPGQKASIATRFVCTRPGQRLRREYSLERDTTVIFVEVPGEKVVEFPFIDETKNITFESAMTHEEGEQATLYPQCPTAAESCRHSGIVLAGYEDGRVLGLDAESAEVRFEHNLEGRINAVASLMLGGNTYYFAGSEEGEIACLDEDGDCPWQREIEVPPDQVTEKLAAVWSSHEPRVRALATYSGGNEPVLIAGYGDGYLYRLDPLSGEELWEAQLRWGCASHLAIADIDQDRFPEIVAGTAYPSVHARVSLFSLGGDLLNELGTLFDNNWSMPTQTTALLVADIDGDGQIEIVRGAANNVQHVACWRNTTLLWTVDCGEFPVAIVSGAEGRLLVGSRSGWVFLMGADGAIHERAFVGETIRCAAAYADGFIIGGRSGGLHRMDPETGEVGLLSRFGTSVESLVPSNGKLIALTKSGEVHVE